MSSVLKRVLLALTTSDIVFPCGIFLCIDLLIKEDGPLSSFCDYLQVYTGEDTKKTERESIKDLSKMHNITI